jgi:hypothetical protein
LNCFELFPFNLFRLLDLECSSAASLRNFLSFFLLFPALYGGDTSSNPFVGHVKIFGFGGPLNKEEPKENPLALLAY